MAQHEAIIQEWQDKPREAAQRVVEKYGPPDEACATRLIWHRNGPWKRTEVWSEPVHHEWPFPHDDMVQSFLDYKVPSDKCGDLVRFDGSVVVARTRGEISACCEAEEANFLALNLAHDIIRGKRGVLEARAEYAKNMQQKVKSGMGTYMQGLLFEPPMEDTADPDQATLDAQGERLRPEDVVLQQR